MMKTLLGSGTLCLFTLTSSAQAEIVKTECKLSKYGDTPLTEVFPCDFRQNMGNVQVWSKNWNFEFLEAEQGKSYVRINSNPLSFHRIGLYSLFVFQNGMPAQIIPKR